MTGSGVQEKLDATRCFNARVDAGSGRFLASTRALWQRELVRFSRQRSRVLGSLATPIVFWILLGSGFRWLEIDLAVKPLAESGTISYAAYLFPGVLVMIVLFSSIYSMITVIEDRREGFLQSVLVAPVPRGAIVAGKVLGAATVALLQGIVFLAFWPSVAPVHSMLAMACAVLVILVLSIGLAGLGLCFAWSTESAAVFHTVMNLLLLPMWFLCGAMFPVESAPLWLRTLMYLNPLTYGRALLAEALYGSRISVVMAASVTVGFAAGVLVLALWIVSRPRSDGS